MNTQQDNAQDHNIPTTEPTPQDPTTVAQDPTKLACTGLAQSASQEAAEGPELSRNGLTDSAPVDPHEVRARLTRRGTVHGLELNTGTGSVFIPQHALPDLRRRLLVAQDKFAAMAGPVPGKRRKRRPASAR